MVSAVEKAVALVGSPRPGRAGRGDPGACPGRRNGGRANPRPPQALGRIGPRAAAVAPRLIGLSKEADETLRCQAAQALGEIGGGTGSHGGRAGRAAARRQCPGEGRGRAGTRCPEEGGRTGGPALWFRFCRTGRSPCARRRPRPSRRSGPLDQAATDTLVEGLASPDNVVRAQTAQALGTIGAAAEEAAPALVEAMADDNDRVRAEAVEALGKIGEPAADGRRSRPGAGTAGSRQLASAPRRPKPWGRWGSRTTRRSPPWSIR